MSITVQWDNMAQTVLRWEFHGDWTWEEMLEVQKQGAALMCQVDHIVDSIVDLSGCSTIPANVISMYKIFRERLLLPDNRGVTLVVGCSPHMRAIISTFSKVSNFYGQDFSLADSLEEARLILGDERLTA